MSCLTFDEIAATLASEVVELHLFHCTEPHCMPRAIVGVCTVYLANGHMTSLIIPNRNYFDHIPPTSLGLGDTIWAPSWDKHANSSGCTGGRPLGAT